ncbi:polysaccharide biosynthesis protein [Aestuariibius sp. 2305UL40-4]|uniref:polysaccharide biosynthesis protein n=1 Tax=Aestuariibius violaceus TaxID=3234132 RepID=UPI00398F7CF7
MIMDALQRLTRRQRQGFLFLTDLAVVPIALWCSLAIEGSERPLYDLFTQVDGAIVAIAIAALVSVMLGMPRVRLKSYDTNGLVRSGVYSAVLSSVLALLGWIAGYSDPGFWITFAMCFFIGSAMLRLAMLQIVLIAYRRAGPRRRVLIYGAGSTGLQLATALRHDESVEPVGFIDDNPAMQGLSIAGLPVASSAKIEKLIRKRDVSLVCLAMPSLSAPRLNQIARRLEALGVDVQALPSFAQLIGAEALADKLTPVRPDTFVGRETFNCTPDLGCDVYSGRSILVTGAGGSIGSELCRQLLGCRPTRLVLFDVSEAALYQIERELSDLAPADVEVIPSLGSVTDDRQIRDALDRYQIDVVLHAAAYKHVPLVEANPLPGLSNNVLGTAALARAAKAAGCERFVLVSSDKAVRPKGIMGASKRLAEMAVQDLASRPGDTIFAMVRFGNVLGSSGSVVPLFQDQVARGGPLTVTHEDVTRFFMTVTEAARLVLLSGSFAKGGEVFVLDMGTPVPIKDLARQVIESSGYTVRDADNPDGDIEIAITGLRPGEKLHEELLVGEDRLETAHEKIFAARERHPSEIEVAGAFRALTAAIDANDEAAARKTIARYVEGYRADDSVSEGVAAPRG